MNLILQIQISKIQEFILGKKIKKKNCAKFIVGSNKLFVRFTVTSINSFNNWGQVTDNFFLRTCLLSGKLRSFLCNYSIIVVLAACKVLLAFTEKVLFFFFCASQLAFFFWANFSISGVQNIFSTLIVYQWDLFEQGAKWLIITELISIMSSVAWHQKAAGGFQHRNVASSLSTVLFWFWSTQVIHFRPCTL